ncbi:helix-turn-helix transcriptional regulator [Micromonospora sp. NPDC049679]|uniref:helix-turn-helix domain-containing protein n=1 Tax=Micromonospora sp. NPDC049679 TaxID=3155920 RepID=UPI0033C37DCC
MARTIVDPRFGDTLRRLRNDRALSLRELARQAIYGKSYLHDLETGLKQPTAETAKRLDEALQATGELARLVHESDAADGADRERLSYVLRKPAHLDAASVDSLATVLAHQRRLEDVAGSASLVGPVLAQLKLVDHLVVRAAGERGWRELVDVASQWAYFAGWLCATTGNHTGGRRWYWRAGEWATEAGNANMFATSLQIRGHLAWVRGRSKELIELSRGAAAKAATPGVQSLAVQQEARGLALIGDAAGCDARLAESEALAVLANERRDDEPPWMYFFDSDFFALQRGLAQHYLGRHDRAAELLTAGLEGLPPDLRRSDWIGWYVLQLAAAHAAAGDVASAVDAVDEARTIAQTTGALRLAGEVDALVTQFRL